MNFYRPRFLITLFFLVLFTYLLLLNFQIPLSIDDYCNTASYKNFGGALLSLYGQILHWGGSIPVLFAQTLVFWKGTHALVFFNLLNALAFCGLIYATFLLAFLKHPSTYKDLFFLSCILFFVWFLPSKLGETCFWKTGATAYLWPMVGVLFFLYPYIKLFIEEQAIFEDILFWQASYFLLGLIWGDCANIISATSLSFLLFFCLYQGIKKKSLPRWAIAGTLGFIFASSFLFLAPGNHTRLQEVSIATNILHENFNTNIFKKILPFSVYFLYYNLSIFIVGLLTIFATKKNLRVLFFNKVFYLFFILAILSGYALLGTPFTFYEARVLFFSQILFIISITSLFKYFPSLHSAKKNGFKIGLIGLLLACFIFDSSKTYLFYHHLHQEEIRRNLIIKESIASGKVDITVPSYYGVNPKNNYHINNGRLYIDDITTEKTYWINLCVSQAYGLEGIQAEDTDGVGAPGPQVKAWMLKVSQILGLNLQAFNHGLVQSKQQKDAEEKNAR